MQYLDKTGLTCLYDLLKNKFATKDVVTKTNNGLMSSTQATQLENVAVDVEQALDLFIYGTSEAEFEAELDKILS